jgi:type IV pilus assembly protein PilA
MFNQQCDQFFDSNFSGQPAISSLRHSRSKGFTLIELMIVITVIAIILTLALPTYSDYSIRAKISEGLSVAAAAKTATSASCQEDRTLTGLTNNKVGYSFNDLDHEHIYVESIEVTGECIDPLITIVTKNTGAPDPAPIITVTGDFPVGAGRVSWSCSSPNTPHSLLPSPCRS